MKKSLFVVLLSMFALSACSHMADRGTASDESDYYKASHFDKRVR